MCYTGSCPYEDAYYGECLRGKRTCPHRGDSNKQSPLPIYYHKCLACGICYSTNYPIDNAYCPFCGGQIEAVLEID